LPNNRKLSIIASIYFIEYIFVLLFLKNRKTILTIVALIFLVGPFISTSYFIMKKQDLKTSFLNRFEKRTLHTIELNKNEIVWESKDKEIIIKNRLFDIKSITYRNNKAIVTGWYDNEEDDVNIALNKNHNQSKKEKNTIPFFSYTFYEQIIGFKIETWNYREIKKYCTLNFSANSIALTITAPPPKT
jgi:hypothetical protein